MLAANAADGFSQSLFDGKTLNGWTAENGCKARVKDGMILLESGNGWLRTDHTYADFKLHIEWKALQEQKYDAGIFLRTPAGGSPFPKGGYQANLLQGKEGNIGNVPGAASTGLAKPFGQWNTFDITVIGEVVQMKINGKQAYRVAGIANKTGYIGIQIEVPLGGQFLVKNIRVTELGHRSLFNGKDLTGFEGAGQPAENCWAVEDGLLVGLQTKGPWLRTKEEYENFNLRLEYRIDAGANSGVFVRVPANGNHHRANDTQPPAGFEVQILDDFAEKYSKLKRYQYCGSVYDIAGAKTHVGRPAGQWNTLELNCDGYHITSTHNGVVIVDVTADEFPLIKLRQLKGYLGFQNHGGGVAFRNIRIGPALPTK
jgi:hypothetical protein